jgi:hypothetical protein
MNKKINAILAAGLLTLGMAAQACTLGAWDTNGSTSLAGGPDPVETNVFARYSGLCAMQTAGVVPRVLNNGAGGATSGPAGEASMIARFYFKADGNTGTLFDTYEDDASTALVYTASFDGTSVFVSVNGGAALSAPVGSTNWHSVEISWANNGGVVNLWVDSDATTAVADDTGVSVGTGTINAVRLGGVAGMTFDAYESRRSTAIGRLTVGDSTGDSAVNIFDAIGVVNEIQGNAFNTGTPDCTEDGAVNIFDAICVVGIINN